MNVGISPELLQLLLRKKKQDLQSCIICLKFKDKKEIAKLTNTEADEIQNIQYQVVKCIL